MQIPENLIKELQVIIKTEYGRDVSLEETEQLGSGLVGHFDYLSMLYHGNKEVIDKKFKERQGKLPAIG